MRMNRAVASGIIYVTATAVVSSALIISAVPHLNNPFSFLAHICRYSLVPAPASVFAAALLPYLQLVIGVSLLATVATRSCLVLSLILFIVYMVAQLSVLVRGLEISCGCFSTSSTDVVSWKSLLLTSSLASLALVAFFTCPMKSRIPDADLHSGPLRAS